MLVGQLSRYAHANGLKTLVIDMDDQGNQTKALARNGTAAALPSSVTQIMLDGLSGDASTPDFDIAELQTSDFDVLPSDGALVSKVVEPSRNKVYFKGKQVELASKAHANFAAFIEAISGRYDICLIDSPPQVDIRVLGAMSIADYILCPIQLAQESIEGMASTLNGPRGILKVKGHINKKLEFLGFFPNMVEGTNKQKEALVSLGQAGIAQYILRDGSGQIASIKRRQAFAEAQANGVFIKDLGKHNSQARETWHNTKPVFDLILRRMQLMPEVSA